MEYNVIKEAKVWLSGEATGGIPLWQLKSRSYYYGQEIAKERISKYKAITEGHSFLNADEDTEDRYYKQEFSRVFHKIEPRKQFTKIFKQLRKHGTFNRQDRGNS